MRQPAGGGDKLDESCAPPIRLRIHVTVAAREQMTGDAREELDRYHAIVKTKLDITDHSLRSGARVSEPPLFAIFFQQLGIGEQDTANTLRKV